MGSGMAVPTLGAPPAPPVAPGPPPALVTLPPVPGDGPLPAPPAPSVPLEPPVSLGSVEVSPAPQPAAPMAAHKNADLSSDAAFSRGVIMALFPGVRTCAPPRLLGGQRPSLPSHLSARGLDEAALAPYDRSASVRAVVPSLAKTRSRWTFAVSSPIARAASISRLLIPRATSSSAASPRVVGDAGSCARPGARPYGHRSTGFRRVRASR